MILNNFHFKHFLHNSELLCYTLCCHDLGCYHHNGRSLGPSQSFCPLLLAFFISDWSTKKTWCGAWFHSVPRQKKRSHHMQTRCLYVGLIRRGEKNPKVHDWPELLLLVKTIARNDYPNSLDGSLWMVDRHYYSRLDRAAYRASLLVSSLSKFLYCQLSLDPPRPTISN